MCIRDSIYDGLPNLDGRVIAAAVANDFTGIRTTMSLDTRS